MRAKNRKRQRDVISIGESQYSAQSSIKHGNAQIGRTKLATIIGGRLSKLHNLEKMQMIRNVMHNLYGRHYAINYKPQFNFQEGWQNCQKQTNIGDKFSMLNSQHYLYIGFHFTLCILFGLTTWFFTVYRLFQMHQVLLGLISTIVFLIIGDGLLKQYLIFEAMEAKPIAKSTLTFKKYLGLHKWGIIFLAYLIWLMVEQIFLFNIKTKALFLVDIIFVWISYQRFKQLYSGLKIKILASKYRNEIMIIQLFGGCILLVHIFAVFLYLVSFVNENNNWTTQIKDFSYNWISRYVFSLYFACTTALTVGYGDVTPQNLFQIITILCVQIIGLINIGYIVNQIGRILSKMNESQQMLHKNISQAEKMTKNYQLPQNIVRKMRTYIINNQIASNQLNVQQEDSFLKRLNDEIRDQVTSHNQLRIIKTSMFFLCHWSKKFQSKIATKLVRCLYSPQQTISQIHGNQKLYILTKGKLQIQAYLSKNPSNELTRSLNFLECKQKDDVHFNVYGYSALVSGLIINLKAVVRDYSICYKVDKEDVLKTIIQTKHDFQYFHQIKARIEQSRFKEIFQAPNIANTRQHYLPNPYFIIKKDRMKLKEKNKRKYQRRNSRKQKLGIQNDRQFSEQDCESEINSQNSKQNFFDGEVVDKGSNSLNTLLSAKERQQKYKATQDMMISSRKYRRKNPKKIIAMNTVDLERQEKIKIIDSFDENKYYKHFQSKYNLSHMIQKYREIFQKNMKYQTATKSELSKAFDDVGHQVMEKLLTFKKVGSCYNIS